MMISRCVTPSQRGWRAIISQVCHLSCTQQHCYQVAQRTLHCTATRNAPNIGKPRGDLVALVADTFPATRLAVGYGSGVFHQAGRDDSKDKPMVDMMLVVDDAKQWHRDNMQRNPSHYSFVRWCGGASAVAWLQRNTGAGMWYHPYITIDDQVIKYGVMQHEEFERDFIEWNWLFVSGRFHKPVALLTPTAEADDDIMRTNLRYAVDCALLLLPRTFSERDLFLTIAGLSYQGDVRFAVGAENPGKVASIVDGSYAAFQALYAGTIQRSEGLQVIEEGGKDTVFRNTTFDGAIQLRVLPRHVQEVVKAIVGRDRERGRIDDDDIWSVPSRQVLRTTLVGALASIVRAPALAQHTKGVISAGPYNSIYYLLQKLRKGALK